jgi:hypothetical protein
MLTKGIPLLAYRDWSNGVPLGGVMMVFTKSSH